MKTFILFKAIFVIFFSSLSFSQTSDPIVHQMASQFIQTTPMDWHIQPGRWKYFDVKQCFLYGASCFGNNPTSPYGFPLFESTGDVGYFKLNPSEAVVLIFRTPPQLRYFGFTQYLFQRSGQVRPAFGSLGDTLNLLDFKVIDQNKGVFDNYAVIVWTADLMTFEKIKNQLALQGLDENQINLIEMPLQLPLFMGYENSADTFSMLLRMAMPTVQQNLDVYIAENPMAVFKTGPNYIDAISPGRALGYKNEMTGYLEGGDSVKFQSLKDNLEVLKNKVRLNYSKTHSTSEQSVSFVSKVGWDCIAGSAMCNGDNHDALYTVDTQRVIQFTKLDDFVIVVGVNHKKTGKSLYMNHTVYDTVKSAGIVSVTDEDFSLASALYHAGIRFPSKEDLQNYSNMFAYAVSYNCGTMKYCLQIPAPTLDNPVGLKPLDPFFLLGRIYVEPRTGVRPASSEIVKHHVLIGNKK